MPALKRVEEFITKVETNKHDEAIEEFYTEDASIQENNSKPRIGKLNLIENERKMLAKTKSVYSKCIRPVFINGNHVVIRWKFRFDWLDGTVTDLEEMSYQFWKEELISKEKFFYDPKQFEPKKIIKENMTKQEIFKILKTEFGKVTKLLNEFTESQVFQKTSKKDWSIAENIEHLMLASKPLVQLFSNPEMMASNWGKSNRVSRKYNEVVELYLKHIGIPGFTTKHYTPTNMKFTKSDLNQNFNGISESLIDKASSLSEEDLDNYQIPHPLIGLMTCREFLYFTHYHTTHHLKTIIKTLQNN